MVGKTLPILIFYFFAFSGSLFSQPGVICNWTDDKQAAVVLTFDDWSPGHYPIVVPELKSRNMVATFFPILTSITSRNNSWAEVKEALSYGNEMGSHSQTHPNLTKLTPNELSNEVRGAKEKLEANLPGETILSFDYPFGAYNAQVTDTLRNVGHIAARGVIPPTDFTYGFANTDQDYYELNAYAMGSETTTDMFFGEIAKAMKGGGLLIYMYHSVDDANGTYNDNWYAKVLQDSLQKQLDTLLFVKDQVWTTTMGQAIKYHREANCATLLEVSAFDGQKRLLNLTDTLSDNQVYNQPLSLKIKTDGIKYMEVSQNGNRIPIDTVFSDTIMFRAIPDGGTITLSTLQPQGSKETASAQAPIIRKRISPNGTKKALPQP